VEKWRSELSAWILASTRQRKSATETFSEEQRNEIISCLPAAADVGYAIKETELWAGLYKILLDKEHIAKKREKILGLCSKLNAELSIPNVLTIFNGSEEVFRLSKILRTISGQKRAFTTSSNASQEARNLYMEGVLQTWLKLGGKLGGAESPMVKFFCAAWPKTLSRHRPTNAAIVNWAYTFDRGVKAFQAFLRYKRPD
jgi:hypothetical protein